MLYQRLPRGAKALLIGVAEYDDYFGRIDSSQANLDQLRQLLTDERLGGLPDQDVTVLRSPTQERMVDEINQAAKEHTGVLLCYFAGHGHAHPERDGFRLRLLAKDATKEDQTLGSVRYAWLRDKLLGSKAERVVLILDCCFSGNAIEADNVPASARSGKPFALITSSQPQHRHGKGDGLNPTPFTGALLTVLRGTAGRTDPITVGSLETPLRALAGLDKKKAEEAPADSHPGDWWPNVRAFNEVNDTILSLPPGPAGGRLPDRRGRQLRPRPAVSPGRKRTRDASDSDDSGNVPEKPDRRRGWLVIGAGVLGLVLIGGIVLVRQWPSPPSGCPIPLQLSLLTSPEYEQPMTEVIEAFEDSDTAKKQLGDRPEDCRQLDVHVYSASGETATEAFQNSAAWAEPQRACRPDEDAEDCEHPLRDYGPRPDVWLAASPISVDRVREATEEPESALSLGVGVPVASSPAVVAVPGGLSGVDDEDVNAYTLDQLLGEVTNEGMEALRSAPASSDASLAHGLRADDGQLDDEGLLLRDDSELLCSLADVASDTGERLPALLLAERSMVPLVRTEYAPACLTSSDSGFVPDEQDDRYTAYYPTDVAPLDLSFVPVRWERALGDTGERALAVQRLETWLLGEAGSAALISQGFRGPKAGSLRDDVVTPLRDTVFGGDDIEVGDRVSAGAAAEYLAQEAEDQPARDVVFVVDVSSGSYIGDRMATTQAVLRGALRTLDSEDRYAILTTPGDPEGGVSYELSLDFHDAADAEEVIGDFEGVSTNADIDEALEEGLGVLSGSVSGGRAPLLVLVTDDEDSGDLPDRSDTPEVPVAVVSLDLGCEKSFNQELTSHQDRCIEVGNSGEEMALVQTLDNLHLPDAESEESE
ncbi:caspase family protein [Streptomyces sp. B6B3]|uniref:caspase, EACC1-associated type n=1 Tax=Streptomyces sp. B6B3 TaxID=3153570 RepID=UPI00325C43F5